MSSVAGLLTNFSRSEIDQLFKKGRRVLASSAVTILLAPRQKEYARILLVIPRRVGNAPERNSIKRRLRAIFYQERLYEKSKDCVFIARKGAARLSYDKLKKMVLQAYQIDMASSATKATF